MKTPKRLNLLVLLAMMLALALPAIAYAGTIEGISMHSSPELKITGTIEEIGDDYVVVDGQKIMIGANTETKGSLNVDDVVEVYVRVDSEGNLVAREIESADADDFIDNDNDDNNNAVDNVNNDNDSDDNGNANDNDNDSNANDHNDEADNSNIDNNNENSTNPGDFLSNDGGSNDNHDDHDDDHNDNHDDDHDDDHD